MNTPVLVDWLTLILGAVILLSLGIAVYGAWRKSVQAADRLPGWGRTAQTVAVVAAMCIGFIQIVWGG